MKTAQLLLLLLFISLFMNCNSELKKTSDVNPNFKIGKTGFEKSLKKEVDFDKMSIGTYITNKNGGFQEKGLNLTFQKDNLHLIKDSLLLNYSNEITSQVKKYLLNINNYEFVIIKFEDEKKGEIIKSTSVKIKKELK